MDKTTDNIQFHYLTTAFSFNNRNACKDFIRTIFKTEKTALASLSYVFCDDDYLLTINQDFLKHDYYTDIISFSLSAPKAPLTGEIYISIPRVKENALTHHEPFNRELHRVIFHGVLHFCGYKDKSAAAVKKMRLREEYYLSAYLG